jgi:hypothetical protein
MPEPRSRAAATDTAATAARVTDPRAWGWSGWLADAVPHAAYGVATALAFDRLSWSRSQRLRSTPRP